MRQALRRFDMPDRDPPIPSVPESRTVPRKQTRLSLVWIIPVLAAAVGAWVAVTAPNRVDVDEFNRWDARGVVYMIDMGRFLRLPKSENPA
jgi:hypothetical protein